MKIYISGPIMYAQDDLFSEAENEITKRGGRAVNPKSVAACSGNRKQRTCTLLPHEIEKGMDHSWSCYLRYDLLVMLKCDAVVMLPGWQDSHGARLEHQVATATGLKVFTWYEHDEGVDFMDALGDFWEGDL